MVEIKDLAGIQSYPTVKGSENVPGGGNAKPMKKRNRKKKKPSSDNTDAATAREVVPPEGSNLSSTNQAVDQKQGTCPHTVTGSPPDADGAPRMTRRQRQRERRKIGRQAAFESLHEKEQNPQRKASSRGQELSSQPVDDQIKKTRRQRQKEKKKAAIAAGRQSNQQEHIVVGKIPSLETTELKRNDTAAHPIVHSFPAGESSAKINETASVEDKTSKSKARKLRRKRAKAKGNGVAPGNDKTTPSTEAVGETPSVIVQLDTPEGQESTKETETAEPQPDTTPVKDTDHNDSLLAFVPETPFAPSVPVLTRSLPDKTLSSDDALAPASVPKGHVANAQSGQRVILTQNKTPDKGSSLYHDDNSGSSKNEKCECNACIIS